jgi:hypothetical protein
MVQYQAGSAALLAVVIGVTVHPPPTLALTVVSNSASVSGSGGGGGGLLPQWAPDYSMRSSTIIEPCGTTGYFNSSFAAQFGIVSYWVNPLVWNRAKPMNCSETIIEQARLTKAEDNATHVFAYANLVKALPWMTLVRDGSSRTLARWWGFFLHKKNATGTDATGVLYYDIPDQKDTPVANGDCGHGVYCGEYLWDVRTRAPHTVCGTMGSACPLTRPPLIICLLCVLCWWAMLSTETAPC